MSEEELKNQLNQIKGQIAKLEEMSLKKESYIKKRVNDEYSPQLNDIESELKIELTRLEEVNKMIEQWSLKQKELNANIKTLKNKSNSLEKEKNKYLTTQLKAIKKEKNTNLNAIKVQIKDLEKKLKDMAVSRAN
jgi:chromosome segregation ATPase